MTSGQRSLLDSKKEDGPTLFSLMGQCFYNVGLMEWTNVVGKQCPDNMHLTKENFNKCIRDYLKAVAGFPNIGNQLIRWLCVAKKPAFMMMHKFMWHQVQLFSYLDSDCLRQTMELPMTQEKSKQIFLAHERHISLSMRKQTKRCPRTLFGSWPFLSSARLPTKQLVS